MLNTTSPTFVPSAPNAFPCHTDPSSKTNLQGFWTSHGFEIAPLAKHFKVAFLPPPLEEKEVEHDDEADEEVFPTRPLNDDDNCWCCAQDDDMFVFQTSFFFSVENAKANSKKVEFLCFDNLVSRRGLFLCFFVPLWERSHQISLITPSHSFIVRCKRCCSTPSSHIYYFVVQSAKDIFHLLQQHQEQQQHQYSYANKSASRQQLRFKTCNR